MTEIERHWDRLCIALLTVAGAAPAVALLIFREVEQADAAGRVHSPAESAGTTCGSRSS